MYKAVIFFGLVLITSLSLSGQYRVSGYVADAEGEAEPYATIRVFAVSDTVKPVAIGAAGDDGRFALKLANAGDYRARVASVGRDDAERSFSVTRQSPSADLGTIVMKERSTELGEITVTAQRPLVVKEIDRLGYDVQADEDSRTATVQDILRKVPLVTVEADGTIKVRGSSDFKIYRNGRPNNAFTKNAKDIFAAIPASMIKKIEVITDPGAREDAEGVGAILNIVTLENTAIKGVTGTASVAFGSNNDFVPNPNLYVTTQIDKVTMSAYAGTYHMCRRNSLRRSDSDYTFEGTGDRLVTHRESQNPGNSMWWGLEGSWELDSLNLFTMEFEGNGYDVKWIEDARRTMIAPDGSQLYSYDSHTRYPKYGYMDFGVGVNYQHSTRLKGETVTVSYQFSHTGEQVKGSETYDNAVNLPVGYTGIDRDRRSDFAEHTVQIDWSRPIGSHQKLDTGGKYIFRRNHARNRMDYIGAGEEYTDFIHDTQVAALFADYRISLGRFTLRGGLRYEYSHMSGHYRSGDTPAFGTDLNDWVPNAAVSYAVNDANSLKLSFSRRINRPGIMYLSPAVEESPTSVSTGNPALESARYNELNFNYGLTAQKFNVDFTAGYSFTDDGIISMQRAVDNVLYSTYANAGRNKRFSLSLYCQWSITDKTQWMFNGAAYYNDFANPDALPGVTLKNHGWTGNFYTKLTQRLPWKLRSSVSLSYWSGWMNGVYGETRANGAGAWDHTLWIERSFLKEDRLTVMLQAWNPFGPYSWSNTMRSINNSMIGENVSKSPYNCSFSVRVSYRFGSLNASVKKTSRTISNDDLVGGKTTK